MNNCETCMYSVADEITGEVFCDLDLDEDEVIRLSQSQNRNRECPFYKDGDEYKTVKHQM